MAYSNQTKAVQAGLSLEVSVVLHQLMQRVADYRAYRATVRELSRLSNGALTDLGIARSGIRAAARKAVYGL